MDEHLTTGMIGLNGTVMQGMRLIRDTEDPDERDRLQNALSMLLLQTNLSESRVSQMWIRVLNERGVH